MTLLDEIIQFNSNFVETKEYEKYTATRFPNKRLVVVSCMDTRLTELLPRAMNVKNGDAKFIKNAGAMITHPYGSVMRSILVALYELQAQEVCVIGHHGCGMSGIDSNAMIEKMIDRGVQKDTISRLEAEGVDLHHFLSGFDSVEESVRQSVNLINSHPLLPVGVPVHGMVIDPVTGKLDVVVKGY